AIPSPGTGGWAATASQTERRRTVPWPSVGRRTWSLSWSRPPSAGDGGVHGACRSQRAGNVQPTARLGRRRAPSTPQAGQLGPGRDLPDDRLAQRGIETRAVPRKYGLDRGDERCVLRRGQMDDVVVPRIELGEDILVLRGGESMLERGRLARGVVDRGADLLRPPSVLPCIRDEEARAEEVARQRDVAVVPGDTPSGGGRPRRVLAR